MSMVRIALANLRYAASPDESVALAEDAIARAGGAGGAGAAVICFPECYVPGYRGLGNEPPPPDPAFLGRAWAAIAEAAATANIAVILGTERVVDDGLRIAALVVNRDGTMVGFQDKVQLDPSEDELFSPGSGRPVFQAGELTFGVSICHEGWRYPETVRSAVRQGAQVVFHPHYHPAEAGGHAPQSFGEAANTFHENAVRCRAAENTCYFASVNYACPDSPTTSAVAAPDGTLMCFQPYGEEGLLLADLDLAAATRLLASRYKPA